MNTYDVVRPCPAGLFGLLDRLSVASSALARGVGAPATALMNDLAKRLPGYPAALLSETAPSPRILSCCACLTGRHTGVSVASCILIYGSDGSPWNIPRKGATCHTSPDFSITQLRTDRRLRNSGLIDCSTVYRHSGRHYGRNGHTGIPSLSLMLGPASIGVSRCSPRGSEFVLYPLQH
jgi:hypothetical protein